MVSERDGYPARDFVFQAELQGLPVLFRAQGPLAGAHAVAAQLMVTDRAKLSDDVAEAFFDSLEIAGSVVTEGPVTIEFPPIFPAPARQVETAALPDGREIEETQYSASANGQPRIATLLLSKYPQEILDAKTPEQVFDDSQDGLVSSSKGEVQSQSKVDFDCRPGRELIIRGEVMDAETYLRFQLILLADGTLVQASMAAPSQEAVTDKLAEAFFDSLEGDAETGATPD